MLRIHRSIWMGAIALAALAMIASAAPASAQGSKPRDGKVLNGLGIRGGIQPHDAGDAPMGADSVADTTAHYDIKALQNWGIAFGFNGPGSTVPGSIDFSHPTNVTVRITDGFCTGDSFRLYDAGRVVLETPRVANDAPNCTVFEDDPSQAFDSPLFSHGEVVLPAGSHSLTIQAIDSPYGTGAGFLEVAHLDPTVNPNRQLGSQVHLPILNFLGQDDVCDSWIEVQNVGCERTMAALITWGEPGFCPPQAAGPLKVECTGMLKPGSTWNLQGAQVPTGSKSGILFKLSARQLSEDGIDVGFDDITGSYVCELLFFGVVGDADDYRRFKKAYDEGLDFQGVNMALARGSGALAVDVHRTCPGTDTPGVDMTSKYNGIAGDHLGVFDDVYGGYSFYVPLAYASKAGMNSIIYIQNGGLQCSSVEIWFKQLDDCLRATICDIATLAPGETYQLDANDCVGPDFQGSAWIRATQKMGIVVDITGQDTLMTYVGEPSEINYSYDPNKALFSAGNQVGFAPLTYSEYQGWDTGIQVQNLSPVVAAKVKVYFLDRGGDIITTLVDWVCPRGSQTFFLPVVADLPGNWVGSARVESQEWITPGGPNVLAPNIVAVATLIKYSDVARTTMTQAIAYNLLPEHKIFDWQIASGTGGGLDAGVGLVAIPSLLKDLAHSGLTSELAITNVVPKPGFTDLIIYIFDQNGLMDYVCQKLNEKQVEYIDLQTWGYVNNGFKGSAIISAFFWEHDVFNGRGQFERNLVGLGAVAIERRGGKLGEDVPGDEAAGDRGIPFAATYDENGKPVFEYCFMGGYPLCAGFPDLRPIPCGVKQASFACSNCPSPIPQFGVAPAALVNVRGEKGCTVSDIDITLNLQHTWIGDLNINVSSPAVTGVTLVNQICNTGPVAGFSAIMDSDAAGAIGTVCPPTPLARVKPGGPGVDPAGLDQFDRTDPNGQWSLNINDLVNGDGGTVNSWAVNITYK
ncbi:MAG: proprotein convertase P-domain-containing protein [Ardenticatenales bacterium]